MYVCVGALEYSVSIQKHVACLVRSEVPLCLLSPVLCVSLHSAKIVLIVCNAWQRTMTTNCFQPSRARAAPRAVTMTVLPPSTWAWNNKPWHLGEVAKPVTGFI